MKKVYGPYTRKDGRKHVIHYDTETKKRITQSYPRYLMEQARGVILDPEEHVDHVNNDPTDDRVENYQLLSQRENQEKARIFHNNYAKTSIRICPFCKVEFEHLDRQYRANQLVQNKRGPYCSRRCAGKDK